MAITTKKTPWEKEWIDLQKKEAKFTHKRKEGPTSVLMQKLDKVVPKKLRGTEITKAHGQDTTRKFRAL